MTPRMYFALDAVEAFVTGWNVYEKLDTDPYVTAGAFVSHGFASLLVGFVLLLGAPLISALAVPASVGHRSAPDGRTNV